MRHERHKSSRRKNRRHSNRRPSAKSRSERCAHENKRIFTYREAEEHAQWARRRFETTHGAYTCRACGGFHVGSSAKRRKRR